MSLCKSIFRDFSKFYVYKAADLWYTILNSSSGSTASLLFCGAFSPFFNLYFTANALLQSNNKRIFHISPERTPPYCGPVFRVPEPGLNRRNRTSAGETGPRGQRTSFFCYACRSPFLTGSHGEIPTYFCRRLSSAPAISKEFYHLWQKN